MIQTQFPSTCLAYFLVHNTTVLTKIINDVNHILSILDKKTKVKSFPKRRQESVPVEQIKMLDTKNSSKDDSSQKKKSHHQLLKSYFDSVDGNDDGDSDYGSGDVSDDSSSARVSGNNAMVRKQYAHESLNDLEDDMENEVSTLLAQLGSNFTRDSSQLEKVATHSNGEISYSKQKVEKSNTDYHKTRTSDADEDILDMITNILEDRPLQMTKHIDMRKEKNAEKVSDKKDNIANASTKDTYFIQLTSKISKDAEDLNKKSNLTLSDDKFSQAKNQFLSTRVNFAADKRDKSTLSPYRQPIELMSNQNENLKASFNQMGLSNELENDNVATSALKQSDHERSKDLDSIWYTSQQSIPDIDLRMSRKTIEVKQKSLKRKEYDEKSAAGTKRSDGKVNGNDTGSILKFQTIPTPNSQLQVFPGAVSYNVKLTNEESPPGKKLKKKPTSRANETSNFTRQSESSNRTILNHPNALSTIRLTKIDNDLGSNEAQAMTRRIFEVGQAAIEAGKNMILAQQSHVDKEKIYDIVGTRNVTSVGKYLITIGEELLNRGKTFSYKKIPSTVSHKHRNTSNFDHLSKNLTGAVSNVDYGLIEEVSLKKIVNSSIPPHKTTNLSCGVGEIHRNSSLRGRLRAGLFIPTGHVRDSNQCARQCCENVKCNMAIVVNDECYAVECFHWTLCQIVPYQGSSQFRSEIISIRRFHHRHNRHKFNDSLNNSSQVNESMTKTKTSSLQRMQLQNHNPHVPLSEEELQKTWNTSDLKQSSAQMPDAKVSEKLTYNHSQNYSEVQGDPKATYVQRKELNCRNTETGGSGNLEPGNWRLSGRTGNSSKCVELCCSQSGCDLAFQIGEFCYSLACYKDNRGCNPLALPVGLSYLRFKQRKKLASKHTDILEEKLPRKVVLNGTLQSGKKDVLERPIERQDDGISNPVAKVFNNSDTSSPNEMTQLKNWVGADGSELCGYSVRKNTFFRRSHNAGEFRQAKNISDVNACAKKCCNSASCDVAYMVENICFLVKCRDESSCAPVSVQNFEYRSSLIYITNSSLGKANLNSGNESAISEEREMSMNKEELKTNFASMSKSRGEQSEISNKIAPAVNKESIALQNGGHKKNVSQANDFGIIVDNDNDNDGDVISDADDDVYGYGTGDDGYGNRQVIDSKHHNNEEELKNFNKHNGFSEHTKGSESNFSKDMNYNGNNSKRLNQVPTLTQPSFVSPHLTASSTNHTKLTSHTRPTTDHQVHGISVTEDLEKKNVKEGTKEISFSAKQKLGNQTLPNTLLVDYSGSGMHDHEKSGTVDDNKEFDVQRVTGHTNIHSGGRITDDPGENRDNKPPDDVGVKVNDIGKPKNGLAGVENSEMAKPDPAKYDFGNKDIPSAISKEEEVHNILRKLEKKDDKILDLFLQPPVLKDKDFNDETYMIYDDADNGEGFRSSVRHRNQSSSVVSHSDRNNLYQKVSLTSQNISKLQQNRSEKPQSEGSDIKISGVNSSSTNTNNSLRLPSVREGNHFFSFDIHKSMSERNKKLSKLKNDTLLNRSNTEKRLDMEIRFLNKTDDAKLGKGVMNINETTLRQRDASGDIIPKSTNGINTLGSAFYSEEKKVHSHKSNSRGRNYEGDEILKPKSPVEVELQYGNEQDYPFDNFPLKREGYSEKVDEAWPWDVIPLDDSFPELQSNNTNLVENPGFRLLEVPGININKQSNTNLSSTEIDSKTGNFNEKSNPGKNTKPFNQSLPYSSNSVREVSVNRKQLHNNLKAVLKSYYTDAAKRKVSSRRDDYHSQDFHEKDKNRFPSTNNLTDQQNRFHGRSSKSPHSKEENHISVEKETNIKIYSSPKKGNNKSLLDQNIDRVGQHNEKAKVDDENPYWILGSAEDLNNHDKITESPGLFPKNEADTDFRNNENFNPYTPFVINGHDQQKVKNANDKIYSQKQMVRDKSEKGDTLPGTIEYSEIKEDVYPSNKKLKDTKSLSNVTDLAEKSDKTTISTSHKLKEDNDSVNERNNATKNFTLISDETSKISLNNMANTSHLANLSKKFGNGSQIRYLGNASESVDSVSNDNHAKESSSGKSGFKNSTTHVRLNQTGVKVANTYSANIVPKNVVTVNQTSRSKYVDSGTSSGVFRHVDDLLEKDENDGQQRNLTIDDRIGDRGVWIGDKKLENKSSLSASNLNKVNNSIKDTRLERDKVKIASSKLKVSFNEGIAPEGHYKSGTKQKAEMNKTKDHSTHLHMIKGDYSLSTIKVKNKVTKNNSRGLNLLTNEAKLGDKYGNDAHGLMRNKSGDDMKTKNLNSVEISRDTSNSSLWSKNSKGDIIPKYNSNKNNDDVSEKDIMELTRPNNYSTEINRLKGGMGSAREEILDNDHFITADENIRDRNIGKVRKFPQNSGEMLPGEQSEYSKLGQILFNDTMDTNRASSLLNGTPEIPWDNGPNESHNYTSVANISSETRNSYNTRPRALSDRKNQHKDIGGKEKNQNNNKSRLLGQNEHGDEIARPHIDIVKTKSIRKQDKHKFRAMKNESEVKDTGRQNSESKLIKSGKGSKFGNTHAGKSNENLNTGESANLWTGNRHGDAIPKPNHDWLSEDEMEETDHHYRLADQGRENELDDNDRNYGNGIELEEISGDDKYLPTAKNSWLSSDDLHLNPNSDFDFGKDEDKNADTDTRFLDVDNEFERNIIPSSKEDKKEIAEKIEERQGKNLVSHKMLY